MKTFMNLISYISGNDIIYFLVIIFDLMLIFSDSFLFRSLRFLYYAAMLLCLWASARSHDISAFSDTLFMLGIVLIGRLIKRVVSSILSHVQHE